MREPGGSGRPETVEQYFASLPAATTAMLRELRGAIQAAIVRAAPDADVTDVISYQIPAVRVDGHNLVFYAGWQHHVSMYPLPDGDEQLTADIAPYRSGQGTVKFPLSSALPTDLVTRIVTALVTERAR